MAAQGVSQQVRYTPDEACSPFVAAAVGLQGVALVLAPTILVVAVAVRAIGEDEAYLTWAVFAALLINFVVIGLHATSAPRLGSGHIVISGPTVQFVAVAIVALSEGGPATLASLMVVCSFAQFAMALWLPALRRVLTPVVTGTVLMLVAATLLPVATGRLNELPAGAPNYAGPTVALVTLGVAVMLTLRATGPWRLWSTLISIAVGCAVTAAFGQYELQRIADAPWAGFPEPQFPGIDLTPGVEFWALLPTFLVLTLVLGTKVVSDGTIIQRVSQREARAIDFRRVQGMVNTNGLAMLLAGLAGTPPLQTYASFSASLISLTGVAARRVGYAIALIFLAVALFPKFGALLLTIPSPVMGAYLLMALGVIFVGGIQTIVQGGLDAQKSLVVGLALSVGLGLDGHEVIPFVLGDTLGAAFSSGVMYGAIVAIGLTQLLERTGPRPQRLETGLDMSELPAIDEFLRELATDQQWDEHSTERLRSAGEETLTSLLQQEGDDTPEARSRLVVLARPGGASMELEFVATTDRENLEDQLAYLSDEIRLPEANEISLRLLRHYASSVRHQKYHGIDIVTVVVERAA
ncbi:MAG: hypothetical protein OXG95_01930 [Chloroflexi bacterium]|nr:hypothetical protein [Chloroflexota bacterium]